MNRRNVEIHFSTKKSDKEENKEEIKERKTDQTYLKIYKKNKGKKEIKLRRSEGKKDKNRM
ncbi:hypothetical protein [Methanosarcina sp. 1.H.A.2.2]|uniref:hypothetical protein n=1 Tax=Methanosarcina sp. 1.H.A.2.2 TaxID=1483601 RepID=UPI0006219711|nr:hypothetical protein [Methanosarcina sp. 1.H.A.2.2]KKH50931.1 hypothetical protein EO93_07500 [Methanosarcina sp. 1.H.A.2.2]